ncbi:MAG: hypothetical protein LBU20_02575, partial [Candidatus Nomurabacteria bacterium]|nr:hypothetical protein [Candidatus Nomurabacteria bacterium]
MEEIVKVVSEAVKNLLGLKLEIVLEPTEAKFGDYASNAALNLAGRLGQNPRDIAE